MPSTINLESGDTVSVYGPDGWTYPTAIDADAGAVMLDHASWGPLRADWYQGSVLGALRDFDSAGWGGNRVMVQYRAGYETIPADIDQIARELAATMYYSIGEDASLQSESIGGYTYTLADQTNLTEAMRTALSKYTREVIA